MKLTAFLLLFCLFANATNIEREQKKNFEAALDTIKKGYAEIGTVNLNYAIKGGRLRTTYVKRMLKHTTLSTETKRELLHKAKLHRDKYKRKKNKEIVKIMQKLIETDQVNRNLIFKCAGDKLGNKIIRDSCMAVYRDAMALDDKYCLTVLDSITNEFGWINESWGGDSNTIFAIIHHNKQKLREGNLLNAYLAMAKQAFLLGEFEANSYFNLEDGELLYNCQPQKHNTFYCYDSNKQLVPCTPQLHNKERCP
jgi:hypothetical protein